MMNLETGGDPSTTLRFLFEVYPELANVTESSEEESEESSESSDESSSEDEAEETDETGVEDDLDLLKDQVFEFGQGSYEVDHVFVLRPNEASNESSEDYLLGVMYDFTNLSEEGVNDYQTDWDTSVTVAQTVGDEEVPLDVATNNEVEESQVEFLLEANATDSHTVYYELENAEDVAVISVNGEPFTLNIENLLKLPLQSALYVTEDATQALIFDFKTLYIVSSEATEVENFNEVAVEDLSPEATALYEQLVSENDGAQWSLYGLEVNYDLNEDESVQITEESEDDNAEAVEVGQVNSEDDWETLSFDGVEYLMVSGE